MIATLSAAARAAATPTRTHRSVDEIDEAGSTGEVGVSPAKEPGEGAASVVKVLAIQSPMLELLMALTFQKYEVE